MGNMRHEKKREIVAVEVLNSMYHWRGSCLVDLLGCAIYLTEDLMEIFVVFWTRCFSVWRMLFARCLHSSYGMWRLPFKIPLASSSWDFDQMGLCAVIQCVVVLLASNMLVPMFKDTDCKGDVKKRLGSSTWLRWIKRQNNFQYIMH